MRGLLVLADGSSFEGKVLAGEGVVRGEVVFNTASVGYPQAFTDPSYRGQILVMAYPLVGNWGADLGFWESWRIQPAAVVVRDFDESRRELLSLFERWGVPLLEGFDTRAIVRRIRRLGAQEGLLVCGSRVRGEMASFGGRGGELVLEASRAAERVHRPAGSPRLRGVLLDFGFKENILRKLLSLGVEVVVLPHDSSPERILSFEPRFLFLSNGPGDPSRLVGAISTVRSLIGRLPIFGICLGCQILALAFGGRTYKLPFGHRGINHPVLDLEGNRAFITSQNHGYAVDEGSLPEELSVSFRHANDWTVEGISHRYLPIRAVQFHPEACPGPRDAEGLIGEWVMGLAS